MEVVLNEGKNRHLRRLFHALMDPTFHRPLKVLDLKRIQVGPFSLDLSAGRWRFSTLEEELVLFQQVQPPATGKGIL